MLVGLGKLGNSPTSSDRINRSLEVTPMGNCVKLNTIGQLTHEMFTRKTPPSSPQPFSRVFPSKWILEYHGQLPHCKKQGVAVIHHIICKRVAPKLLPLDAGISTPQTIATHEVWCICRIPKDRGDKRLLFRQHLDLSAVLGDDRRDWIAYKVTQHLATKLIQTIDLHHLIRCHAKREYPWCAAAKDLDDYWADEARSTIKGLVALLGR